MSLLPTFDKWEFLAAQPADGQAELRILIDELLEDELRALDADGRLQVLLGAHLRVVVVDVVAKTMGQLIERSEKTV